MPVNKRNWRKQKDHLEIASGLGAVKNIGRGLIRQVMAERAENGRFVSLEDFARRMQGSDLNKRAVENLIKCGAMDSLGMGRGQMLAIYEMVLDAAADTYRRNLEGQLQLFGPEDGGMPEIPAPKLPPLRPAELMQMEKETVGLYLSGHPLDEYRTRLRAAGVTPVLRILQSFEENDGFFHDGQNVRIAGMVEEIRRKTTRNGSMMAYVTLEDDTAAMELLTFSNVLERSGSLLTENAAVVAEGRISVRDEKAPQLVVNRFDPLESFTKQAPPPMPGRPQENGPSSGPFGRGRRCAEHLAQPGKRGRPGPLSPHRTAESIQKRRGDGLWPSRSSATTACPM